MTDNTEAVTLEPCPFCGAGGDNLGLFCDPDEGLDNSGPSRRVQCFGCNVEAPFYDSKAEAIAAWNTRAKPDVVEALAQRLFFDEAARNIAGRHDADSYDFELVRDYWIAIARAALAQTEPKPAEQSVDRLAFDTFRKVNVDRCINGFNHTLESWSLSDWFTATMGELGEAANVAKKLNRIRDGVADANAAHETEGYLQSELADEIADTFIYLDLLAARMGIDLAEAVPRKFNKTSEKLGLPHRIDTALSASPVQGEAIPSEAVELHIKRAVVDFRNRARICRTNPDAFDTKAASVWDFAADALENLKLMKRL